MTTGRPTPGTGGRPVDLICTPYAGHLHPVLGIARELHARGVPVRVITAPYGAPDVRAAGLEPVLIGRAADREIREIANTTAPVRSHPVRLARQLRRQLRVVDVVRHELAELYRTAPPALALVDSVMPFAGVLAREHGARWWTLATSPCAIEAHDGPPSYLGGLRPGGPVARLRDAILRRQVRVFKRVLFAANRPVARRMGLTRVYRADGSEAVYSEDRVLALGLAELELATRFRGAVEFVGPVRYTPPRDAAPPVVRSPAVLVTLGTHVPHAKAAMADQVHRAARLLPGVDLVFTAGDHDAQARVPLPNLRLLPWVSYDHLAAFDLVVHHGGSGVTTAMLHAARPALVHPVDYDQFDMAVRLEVAGLAREVRRREDLPAVIAAELSRPTVRQETLTRWQALARAQDGAVRVADLVQQALRGEPAPEVRGQAG